MKFLIWSSYSVKLKVVISGLIKEVGKNVAYTNSWLQQNKGSGFFYTTLSQPGNGGMLNAGFVQSQGGLEKLMEIFWKIFQTGKNMKIKVESNIIVVWEKFEILSRLHHVLRVIS